jgi:peptidoglycan/LPS O-acetylase OafA/YrhL
VAGVKPTSSPRVPALDGLRGIAAAMVIATHYLNGIERHRFGRTIQSYAAFGVTGVDLFFVLSGFLLAGILLDRRHSPGYYSSFYIRRACRIFPLYFVLLLAVVWIVPRVPFLVNDPNFVWGPARAWWFFTYVQNFGMGAIGAYLPILLAPTWSLAVEEQFYAVLPVTIRLLSPRSLVTCAVLAWVASVTLRVVIVQTRVLPAIAISTWSICRLDSLALGVLAAVRVRSNRQIPSRMLAATSAVLLGAAFLSGPWKTPLLDSFLIAAVAAGYTALLLHCIWYPAAWIPRTVSWRVFRWLGTISYGTYLLHAPVRCVVLALFQEATSRGIRFPGFLVTPASLLLTVGLAQSSWTFFERRFVQWSHRHT